MSSDLAFGFFAAILSLALCAVVRRIGLRGSVLIAPREDRWHSIATPSMGGVGFAAAALVAAGASALLARGTSYHAFELAVPASATAMLVLGILDDRVQLSPLAKLVASLIVGALTVFIITESLGRSLPWPATLVAVVWFGGVVHAMNLLDNMDGLAGGIALIAAALLAFLFGHTFGAFVTMFLVTVVGSLVGFLYWNRKPARLFMGDSGSLFLGGTLASASLVAVASPVNDFYHSATLVLLVLVIPLFDTAFVLVLRRLAGREEVRAASGGGFFEVYMSTPLSVCEQRDQKGLYRRARAGDLHQFTGIDDR